MSDDELADLIARAELLEPSDQSIAITQFTQPSTPFSGFQHIASTLGVDDVPSHDLTLSQPH